MKLDIWFQNPHQLVYTQKFAINLMMRFIIIPSDINYSCIKFYVPTNVCCEEDFVTHVHCHCYFILKNWSIWWLFLRILIWSQTTLQLNFNEKIPQQKKFVDEQDTIDSHVRHFSLSKHSGILMRNSIAAKIFQ